MWSGGSTVGKWKTKDKSEEADKIIEFMETAKTQFSRKPKVVRSDQGGDYNSERLQQNNKTVLQNDEIAISSRLVILYPISYKGLLIEMSWCLLFDAELESATG